MTCMTLKLVTITAVAGLMVTGCATTSATSKMAKAAPITYKMGQGNAQYASLDLSNRSTRPGLPSLGTNPRSTTPLGGQGRRFDPSKVDRQLYSHQKVGKRYTIMGGTYTPKHQPDYDQVGEASWYGPKFHGKPTATGETFNKRDMTAAHKTLALNSMLVVTNLDNGRVVTVRLNDRGPFIGDRMIDLSEAAAEALGFKSKGLANVRVQYAGPADPMAAGRTLPRTMPRSVELPRDNIVEAPRQSNPCHDANATAAISPVVPASCGSLYPMVPEFIAPSLPAPIVPVAPRAAPDTGMPSGGDITLTIKGPIHIARSDDQSPEPQFIAERLATK